MTVKLKNRLNTDPTPFHHHTPFPAQRPSLAFSIRETEGKESNAL